MTIDTNNMDPIHVFAIGNVDHPIEDRLNCHPNEMNHPMKQSMSKEQLLLLGMAMSPKNSIHSNIVVVEPTKVLTKLVRFPNANIQRHSIEEWNSMVMLMGSN